MTTNVRITDKGIEISSHMDYFESLECSTENGFSLSLKDNWVIVDDERSGDPLAQDVLIPHEGALIINRLN